MPGALLAWCLELLKKGRLAAAVGRCSVQRVPCVAVQTPAFMGTHLLLLRALLWPELQ